jgi:hypothetical protein
MSADIAMSHWTRRSLAAIQDAGFNGVDLLSSGSLSATRNDAMLLALQARQKFALSMLSIVGQSDNLALRLFGRD